MAKKYNYTKKAGRPKAYTTPEDMQIVIDAYFEECDNNIFAGEPKPTPYTLEGLAVALGIDRHTLITYGKEPSHSDFHATVKKAKDKVLANLAERMLNGHNTTAGAIFLLKNNYGYTDKTEQEVTSNNITTVMFDSTPGIKTKFAHSEDEIDD